MNPTLSKLLMSAPGPAKRGLVAQWDFLPKADLSVLYDLSGRGQNGALGPTTAAPAWTPGGLLFVNDDYVDLLVERIGGTGLFCSSNEKFTIMLASTLSGQGTLIARSSGAGASVRTFQLYRNSTNQLTAIVRGVSSTIATVSASTALYTFVWDGAAAKASVNLSSQYDVSIGTAAEEAGQRIILGARTNGTGVFLPNDTMSYGLLYDTALSFAEQMQSRQFMRRELARRGISI